MHIGFFTFNTGRSMPPARIGRELEDRGYESMWVGEHSHIPTSRRSPAIGGGSELAPEYREMLDPFTSLTAAATVTERLRIGTGVSLILEHDVLALAKTIASTDVLSGGRLLLGVGVGWNEEELANHRPDLPWRRRYRALAERVAALRTIWTEDEASFDGEFERFESLWAWPKPIQHPGPPVIMGSWGPIGRRHAIEYCEGFCPVDAMMRPIDRTLAEFRQQATDAGRDPDTIEITIFCFGDPNRERLDSYREHGVARVVLGTGDVVLHEGDNALPYLDRWADLNADLA